jgi:hypothetical protein
MDGYPDPPGASVFAMGLCQAGKIRSAAPAAPFPRRATIVEKRPQ